MNCQELNCILETHTENELSAAQRRDIERHFSSCRTCRDMWAIYGELLAENIPATPEDLRRRIAAKVDGQEASAAFQARRSIVIGGVLLAGAAMAATLGLAQRERVYPSA